MSNYAHQDAKLWTIVYIGRSKYRAIGRMPNGVMLWKGSGPTIYTLIENAQGEWGLGRYDSKLFASPIAQQFSRLSSEIKRYVLAQQKRGSAITPAGIWKNSGGSVRKNIFTFNNPGNAQRVLAENFVRGANSGVASSMYIHGNRIYSYGPHFPIAERTVLSMPPHLAGQTVITVTAKKSPSKTTTAQVNLVISAARTAGLTVDRMELQPEAKGPAAYSNPGKVRKNIFLFNNPRAFFGNPRELNMVEKAAAAVGLVIGMWAPGDGVTRYRFFLSDGKSRYGDYHQGDGIYTALGRKDALTFLQAYGRGRASRKNPSRAARSFISSEIGHLRRKGYEPKRAVAAAYSMARRKGYRVNPVCNNPSHIDPPGLAELDARMNDLWRRMDAMKKAKIDNGPEYMLLLKEAQAVSKERLKLIGLGGKTIRPNPLLQTVFAANPPISEQWDRMTPRQKQAAAEYAGLGEDLAYRNMRRSWKNLMPQVKRELEASWLDTTSRGGTTKRRRATVVVNPLTRKEAGRILRSGIKDIETGRIFRPGHTRSVMAGKALGKASVVAGFGPGRAFSAAERVKHRASNLAATTLPSDAWLNPGVKLPKPGTRLTVTEALDLARRIGDRSLISQCQQALKLQKKANKNAKCVIWKTFAMGSKDKIDSVVALTHYGDSPETMYRPPKGSKKGPHMYRHRWGEGGGGKKTVPLLASADGKMLLMPLEGRKVASDWLRH